MKELKIKAMPARNGGWVVMVSEDGADPELLIARDPRDLAVTVGTYLLAKDPDSPPGEVLVIRRPAVEPPAASVGVQASPVAGVYFGPGAAPAA